MGRILMSDIKTNVEFPTQYLNTILCGDSLEKLKLLPDNCVDLIVTSPPYNFNMNYDLMNDKNSWEEYFNFLNPILYECCRILRWGGRICINIQPSFSEYFPTHHKISNYICNIENMIWKTEIIWDKHNFGCSTTTWGSWMSPSSPYIRYTNEYIEVFCKGDLKHIGNSDISDLTKEQFIDWTRNYWSIAPENRMKKFNHPAMMPEELAIRLIKLFSFQKDVVLDPFNGVGTTTLCAKLTNRNYVGIDISEQYCKTAEKRMKNTKKLFEIYK